MLIWLPHQEWTHEPHATCFMSRTDCFTCRPGRRRLRTTVVSSWVGQGWRPMGTRMGEVQDRWQTSVLASEKKMWVQHNAALLWTNTFSLHKQIFSVREDLAAHVINSIDLTCDVSLITELFQEAFPQEGLSLMEKKASRKLATIVVSTLGSMRSRQLTSTKIIKRYVLNASDPGHVRSEASCLQDLRSKAHLKLTRQIASKACGQRSIMNSWMIELKKIVLCNEYIPILYY